jgi:hypothetical protein
MRLFLHPIVVVGEIRRGGHELAACGAAEATSAALRSSETERFGSKVLLDVPVTTSVTTKIARCGTPTATRKPSSR